MIYGRYLCQVVKDSDIKPLQISHWRMKFPEVLKLDRYSPETRTTGQNGCPLCEVSGEGRTTVPEIE